MSLHGNYTSIVTLGLVNDDNARLFLTRCLSFCENVIRANNWSVRKLTEFLPLSESLLGRNTNRGELIEIRLRKSTKADAEYVRIATLIVFIDFFHSILFWGPSFTSWFIIQLIGTARGSNESFRR